MRAGAALCLGLAWCGLCATARAQATPPLRYEVSLDATHTQLRVHACVNDARDVVRWRAYDDAAGGALRDLTRSSGGAVQRRGTVLFAQDWQRDECLDYSVDLPALAQAGGRGAAARHEEGWLLAPAAWLWQFDGDAADARVSFTLPAGWSVAAPWRALDRTTFVFGGSPPDWPMLVALGPLRQFELNQGDSRLRVALVGAMSDAAAANLRTYVAETLGDVRAVFPRIARFAPQLTVIGIDALRDAVPYGESQRGGVGGIVLLADPRRSLEDYFGNWTLTHELTHLAHPYLGTRGRWVGEGIATYFQYVIRARAGRITPREAWAQLHAGFGRGRADRGGDTLAAVSAELSRNHRYMRAYWSGAALALTADVRLRQRASGASSLEAALNAYDACCLRTGQYRAPRAFLAALDRAVGGDVFVGLFDDYAGSTRFPDLAEAYAALGLDPATGAPRADVDERTRALRRAIVGGE
jgi:predicted metalloprotease with PDZ domain